ncbi:MAG: hypothetical protein HC860_20805 [Alkalinema sp. RU_4_3]|nr:hypothetical protein [Alkalinema sp. RU_4_3]
MSQTNYLSMSERELRQYWLSHKEDKLALEAYLERRSQRPQGTTTFHPDDADFEERLNSLVQRQLQIKQ